MRKTYFVILNSIIVARENSLASIIEKANKMFVPDLSEHHFKYQTVYSNIKLKGFYNESIETNFNNIKMSVNVTFQELDNF